MIRTRTLATVAMLGSLALTAACGDSSNRPGLPTAPTPAAPVPAPPGQTPVVLYSLSGTVFEVTASGRSPIPGVLVELMSCPSPGCGSNSVQRATTDQAGFYSFQGVHGGPDNFLWLTKEGYSVPIQLSPGCDFCYSSVSIDQDKVFDIELARR